MKQSQRGVLVVLLAAGATIGVLRSGPLTSQPANSSVPAQAPVPLVDQAPLVKPVAPEPIYNGPPAVTVKDLQDEGERITKAVKADADSHAWRNLFGALILAIVAVIGNFLLQLQRSRSEDRLATRRLEQENALAVSRLQQEDTLATRRIEFEGASATRKAALEAAQSLIELRVQQMGELYGPLRALLAQSKGVYDQLANHLKEIDPDRYRHVEENPVTKKMGFQYLQADGKWRFFALLGQMPRVFQEHTSAIPLIDEVVFIGERIVEVIRGNAGRVLPIQIALTAALGEYLSHFAVLKEMHATLKSKGAPRQYHVGFYPRHLNRLVDGGFDLIASELSQWEERLHRVSAGASDDVATEADDTIAYYNREADSYVARTIHANLSPFYDRFLANVAPRARILDVGSGSGRDLMAFRTRGFEPFGIEPSRELALRARAISGEECRVMRIEELSWPELFGGVWAVASLHHLQRESFAGALAKLAEQLEPGAPLYFSVSEGPGEKKLRDGRYFANYTREEVEKILNSVPSLHSVEVWTTPDADPDRKGVMWINALAKKVNHPAG